MIVICSSSDPQQLRALLATLDSSTFRGVISFGVAGGLDPSLKSGDVVVATEVLAGDTRLLAGLALNEGKHPRAARRRRPVGRRGRSAVAAALSPAARGSSPPTPDHCTLQRKMPSQSDGIFVWCFLF